MKVFAAKTEIKMDPSVTSMLFCSGCFHVHLSAVRLADWCLLTADVSLERGATSL